MNPGVEGSARFVALKCLHPHLDDEPKVVEMFYREARIGALFRHGNLVQVSDVRKMSGRHTMVMQFAAGVTLRQVLDRLAERQEAAATSHVVEILQQVCRGMHHAHTLRRADGQRVHLVHRDLSPDNIIVGFDGVVRVIDFGVAAATSKENDSGLAGKIAYMSPEQVRGEALDARSDLYSVGTILWELLMGRAPYPRTDRIAALRAITEGRLPRPAEASGRDASNQLDRVWERLHSRDRELRFNDAREVADALDVYSENVSEGAGETLAGWILRLFPHEAAETRTTCDKILRAPTPSEHTVDLSDPEFRTLAEQDSCITGRGSRGNAAKPPPMPVVSGGSEGPALNPEMTTAKTTLYSEEQLGRWRRQRIFMVSAILVLVGCVIALSVAYTTMSGTQQQVPISFLLMTSPESVSVSVDGTPQASNSPFAIRANVGQVLDLRMESPGYLPWNQRVTVDSSFVRDGLRVQLLPDINSPVAPIGEVRVNYAPKDAVLLINGEARASASPAVVSGIALNTLHTLRLEREGYQTLFLDLRLVNDQPLTFDLQMSEGVPLARLTVRSEPQAEVFIDGQLVGTTPLENLELPANTAYELSLRAPGWQEWRQGVALQNDDMRVNARLTRVPSARVEATPEVVVPQAPARRSDDDLPYRMIE